MQLKLYLNSAYELKNVNWRYGELQPYAVAWIDTGAKRSTKIDVTNGENPVWNEMFNIPLPSTSHPDTAIVYIDIVHAKSVVDMKPLVGSTRFALRVVLDVQGKASFLLNLERPSGRPQGTLDIQTEVLDLNLSNQQMPYVQPTPYMTPQQQLQTHPQPRPRPQPPQQQQPQFQARQMNRYPNNVPAGTMRPGYYPVNAPQNFRPPVGMAQQPVNGVVMPNMRPQYRPVGNQQTAALGNALCTLAFGVNPRQIGQVLGSFQRMTVSAFRPQPVNMGMVNNTGTGLLNNGANGAYPYDPSAAQGYDNTAGYDAVGTSDNTGYDTGATGDAQYGNDVGYDSTGAYVDGQYGTDGGFGCDGSTDLGGFDSTGGLDMGMFGDGTGVDLGGFDTSGVDLGGFDASGLDLGGLDC